ncbi:MAG: RNA 2'-phosphotransferase [Ferruginibacter sp.]
MYHGTAGINLTSILKDGIRKMNRQHFHLSQDQETALKVGSRHGRPIILTVASNKMQADGLLFLNPKTAFGLQILLTKNTFQNEKNIGDR